MELSIQIKTMKQLCGMKVLRGSLLIARTSQQNGVANRKNRTLIEEKVIANITNRIELISPSVSTVGQIFSNANDLLTDSLMLDLEDTVDLLNTGIFSGSYDDEDVAAKADLNNLETTMNVKPKKVTQALTDPSWIEAMQDELLQFRLKKVWRLVDLSKGKHAIGTKWVNRNKKHKRGIVVRNKARLVAQGYTQKEGIYYDQVFALVARIEAISLIKPGMKPCLPTYWKIDLEGFRRGTIDKTLFIKKDKDDILLVQVKQKDDGIFISQDKYVVDILKKFNFVTVPIANTHMETNKALLKDEEAADVDYPRDSPFDLEAFSIGDYAGASLDRKSTTGGCQFLGRRLISWQCKKQTILANSTTEAEYAAAINCCRQVLWIQNQLLDYGYNFMNTKIFIGNESTIFIVKNPVFHSKTKHIEIRHHLSGIHMRRD
ncbi:putative ribonuclease H-like domain-containing protein [Tanacetum coccineum]